MSFKSLSQIPIENLVSHYLGDAINIIQEKPCSWCNKGNWRVIIILAVPKEGDETGFMVKCAVQCPKCLSIEKKEWPFDPTRKASIMTSPEQ